MQLSQLRLTEFRSFAEERVHFEKRLTVLVGENNGGKSNLIDAIRLVTTPLSGRREIFCEDSDVRFGATKRSFEIEALYEGLTPPQQGRLISAATDDTLSSASIGLTFGAANNDSTPRPNVWAGRFKAPPEPGAQEMIRHVYLPPLRDAKRALASGNPTQIHALLRHFLGDRDPVEVAGKLARASGDQILDDVDLAVGRGLSILTEGVRRQSASLGFNTEERLIDIARDLRFKLADQGVAPEDLRYSGHGFANLLYMAAIAVELERADNAELTLFLVEEPEAHLHPQLQAAVLNFLEEQADKSLQAKPNPNAPAGNLQVIVATHSPNLSAWVPNQSIVFVRSIAPLTDDPAPVETDSSTLPSSPVASPESSRVRRLSSRCIPMSRLSLTDLERRKIDRYLDVTKSSLLFGGRVLLVEGIAEALLLPVIAKHHVLKDNPSALRIFRSAVFVPIDGVDFTPYVKMLLTPYRGVQIADRVVVVTDGDQKSDGSAVERPGDARKSALESLDLGERSQRLLSVFVNTYSLETELVAAGNAACLKAVYLALHPRSEAKWEGAVATSGDDRAVAIQGLFASTPKGDFAQLLAEKVATEASFSVPAYLREAIEALSRESD